MRRLSGLPSLQTTSDEFSFDRGDEGFDAMIVDISATATTNCRVLKIKVPHWVYVGVSISTPEEMRSCLGGGGLGGVMDVLNAHVARRMKGILVRDIQVGLGGKRIHHS